MISYMIMCKKGDIVLEFISIEKQLVGIFTKPLALEKFASIKRNLGIIDALEIAYKLF